MFAKYCDEKKNGGGLSPYFFFCLTHLRFSKGMPAIWNRRYPDTTNISFLGESGI